MWHNVLWAWWCRHIKTLRTRRNGRYFPEDIFKCIFVNGNISISIIISLKILPKALINNIPSLVQIMAWHRPGDKPLSEPMLVSSLTHICVIWLQWVNLDSWHFYLVCRQIHPCNANNYLNAPNQLFVDTYLFVAIIFSQGCRRVYFSVTYNSISTPDYVLPDRNRVNKSSSNRKPKMVILVSNTLDFFSIT